MTQIPAFWTALLRRAQYFHFFARFELAGEQFAPKTSRLLQPDEFLPVGDSFLYLLDDWYDGNKSIEARLSSSLFDDFSDCKTIIAIIG